LDDIGAMGRPRLLVFNKIDALEDEVALLGLRARYPGAIFVSALTREGIPGLREEVMRRLRAEDGSLRRPTRAAQET
jgi:GTP-binding protein HflX